MRGSNYEGGARYTITSNGGKNKIDYIIKKQDDLEKSNLKSSKEYKLKTEVLISHVLEKSKFMTPEILDSLDYKPKRSKKVSKLSAAKFALGKYSPAPLSRNTNDCQNFKMTSPDRNSRLTRTIVNPKSPNRNNSSINASFFNDKYGTITKVQKQPEQFSSMIFSEKEGRSTSPYKYSPDSEKGAYKSNLHKVTMFLKTLEMLALHWKVINPNLYRHRLKKVYGSKNELMAIPRQVRESHYYHPKTL